MTHSHLTDKEKKKLSDITKAIVAPGKGLQWKGISPVLVSRTLQGLQIQRDAVYYRQEYQHSPRRRYLVL